MKAKQTNRGTWEVTLDNGKVIQHVFAKDYDDALVQVKNTPEYYFLIK